MTSNITNIFREETINGSNDKITETLSKYTEKKVNKDKTVSYAEIPTTYFLENNKWHIEFFYGIEQFKKQVKDHKYTNKNISFPFNSENINKEMKFIVYNKLFSDKWSLQSALRGQRRFIRLLAEFINEKYPNINSFKELDLEKANIQWIDWLNIKGINTTATQNISGKDYENKTAVVNFLKFITNTFATLTDEQEEWEKDIWDIRNLEQYGVTYNKSITNYYVNFAKINNIKIREEFKKYIKQRLISNNKFSPSTARNYLKYIPNFINYICDLEPTWNDLKGLERHHIEKYIESLNIYVKENLTQKNANPKSYLVNALGYIQKFLSDIQIREYDIAPMKNVRILIFPEDKPKVPKKSIDQINYVPDFVLEQLFDNIDNLHKEVIPVVYTMFKTGLRISDVLGLKHDCLVKLNNKFWVETDIEKTYVEGHRIPIDDELANMLAVLIDNAKKYSNEDNNPENYIFVRYKGSRKGKPYSREWIQKQLNLLVVNYNITDELGKIYHFKNHSFRHTYAIKMLNGGADILTVQELLAHASPEMTMRYAKLLDDTKRKVFDKAVKQGIFSFDESDKLKEENNGEIPSNIIDMLYTNHKLNALDTPYGTCMQRKNGKCSYAKQPPCLTCNNGSPCKDLCVGAFEGDTIKYEILINSTKTMIENAKMYNRTEMVNENEELLKLYENIYSKISQGSMIYSRLDKFKKEGALNE
ncbi:tyrosine-type recombinase/integrase [Clostridium perfringens]|uniref:tyrosine-type recombinase/integrase n=1 Tax=Clostridium perfringens TaxID=1502 RepID=UPI0013E34720|nr:tyrosine-type recombinase/integrase [Clostridium perfringens]MDH2339333.1 tyrosine-type recombinase/integrase [Clostridium perfringens]MDK0839975.1 tyrosine-type recombinase/integrase [Clostridium perfringens]MDM0715858.1 tyrosine-type recombinase/integrase [Clostridium perfringens]MDM0892301.1 tyrosine-type recombinase/integrase [Clostridium perfringens]MDN4736823.1 tyrosine-type recombinase/integrase [Clostridium perfringens]